MYSGGIQFKCNKHQTIILLTLVCDRNQVLVSGTETKVQSISEPKCFSDFSGFRGPFIIDKKYLMLSETRFSL